MPRVSSNSSALRGELFGLYGGRLTRSMKSFGVEVDVESGEPVSKKKEVLFKFLTHRPRNKSSSTLIKGYSCERSTILAASVVKCNV